MSAIQRVAIREFLDSLALLADCSPAQREALCPYLHPIACKRYQELYHEGQPSRFIHVVMKGSVSLEKARGEGREPMRLAIVRAGEYFGLGEFMLAHYHTTATALTDGILLQISRSDFCRHFLAVESVRNKVIRELSEIARYLLFSVVAGSGVNMLVFYLRRLCRESGRVVGGKIHIQTKVHQPRIATLLNMSREHVTRLFAQLQKQGVVAFNRGYPVVDQHWLDQAVADPDLADFIRYRDDPQP